MRLSRYAAGKKLYKPFFCQARVVQPNLVSRTSHISLEGLFIFSFSTAKSPPSRNSFGRVAYFFGDKTPTGSAIWEGRLFILGKNPQRVVYLGGSYIRH